MPRLPDKANAKLLQRFLVSAGVNLSNAAFNLQLFFKALVTIQSAQPIALKILIKSCHRRHHCQVVVVMACLAIAAHRGRHLEKDDLTNLQARIQRKRVMQALVFQFEG